MASCNPKLLWTEEIHEGDPSKALFNDGNRKEILGLIERGTFKIVLEEKMGPCPNIMPSRFVCAIKHSDDGSVRFKARFVVRGHLDKEKYFVVHNSVTLRYSLLRVILAQATFLGFDIWSFDVTQAYLQSAEELKRDEFTKPKEIELQPGELLQLLQPLYGLSDSGDHCCETLAKFHVNNLRIKQATGDLSIFFRRMANRLTALPGIYENDGVQALVM